MGDIIRVKYYVGLDKSMWNVIDATNVHTEGSDIKYNIGFNDITSTELFLESFKIVDGEGLQDKNINRKNFNMCFEMDCFKKDIDEAKAKLKGRVILLLTKHQKKIDKLMSNL